MLSSICACSELAQMTGVFATAIKGLKVLLLSESVNRGIILEHVDFRRLF